MTDMSTALPSLSEQTALSAPAVLRFLNLALGIVATGIQVRAGLDALDQEIQRQVQAGRDPSAEEWQAIQTRAEAAHHRLQDAARDRPARGGKDV